MKTFTKWLYEKWNDEGSSMTKEEVMRKWLNMTNSLILPHSGDCTGNGWTCEQCYFLEIISEYKIYVDENKSK